MAYSAGITTSNPSCLVFLIDQSGSMQDSFGERGASKSKAEGVAEAINALLRNLITKCTDLEGVHDYYRVCVLGYGVGVRSAFGGTLSGREIVPISDIANQPARIEYRPMKIDDGPGGVIDVIVKSPIWFDAISSGGTPFCEALTRAHSILSSWLKQHPDCFPPIVINITDGESTDGDPTNPAASIRDLRSSDGNVLLFNLQISLGPTVPLEFPHTDSGLANQDAKLLFHLSSVLPDFMRRTMRQQGLAVRKGARGFVLNANPVSMIRFLKIVEGPEYLPRLRSDDTPPKVIPAPVAAVKQPYDDDVIFTVYRPNTVVPQKWYSLLAFAHLSERRPDADEDEPDPMVEVQRQAKQTLSDRLDDYVQTPQQSGSAVPRSGEITFKPFIKDVEFNPASRSFRWEEAVHREEFKLRAPNHLDGQVARGWLRAYLGPLVLAQVNLAIRIDSKHATASQAVEAATDSARPLRKVFASYSHHDQAIVEQIEEHLRHAHLGIEYLRDATKLRAGEEWGPRLMEMIGEATAFQLFWSTNSMQSNFVREEYEYALSLRRQHFVLPVYWETPFPERPEENLPPDALRRLHFERLVGLSTGTPSNVTRVLPGRTSKRVGTEARRRRKKIADQATSAKSARMSTRSYQPAKRVGFILAIGLVLMLFIAMLTWLKRWPVPSPTGNTQFLITSPAEGAKVGVLEEVRGITPFPEMNHYLIVTPAAMGIDYVQEKLILRNDEKNSFSGLARFGGPEVGKDARFIIRVLATKSTLQAGPLLKQPQDAVVSNSVTVRRFR